MLEDVETFLDSAGQALCLCCAIYKDGLSSLLWRNWRNTFGMNQNITFEPGLVIQQQYLLFWLNGHKLPQIHAKSCGKPSKQSEGSHSNNGRPTPFWCPSLGNGMLNKLKQPARFSHSTSVPDLTKVLMVKWAHSNIHSKMFLPRRVEVLIATMGSNSILMPMVLEWDVQ